MFGSFFIKISTGGKCKICNRDVKAGGSGGNTTNLKNHLLRQHSNNPLVLKEITSANDKKEKSNDSNPAMSCSQQILHLDTNCTEVAPTLDASSIALPSTSSSIDFTENSSTPTSCQSAFSVFFQQPEMSQRSESEYSSSSRQSVIQPTIDVAFKQMKSFKEGGSKFGEITNAILYMIAKDNLPLNTVEKEGFKYLLKTTAPLYSIPCRKTITRRIEEKYEFLSECEKKKLETIDHFSITADLWTDTLNTVSYLGMTAHYVFQNDLQSTTIGVTEMTERHTSEVIGKWMSSVLDTWHVQESKVVAFVTDNASNIVKAVNDTFEIGRHLPCFAHTLNLTATQTMDFQESNTLCAKVKGIIKFFKESTSAADELRKVSDLKLIQSVETRWNSTFEMLERFILLSDKISPILLKMPNSPPMLTANELHLTTEIVEILRPLEAVTKEICGELYVTCSKLIPIVSCLKKQIESLRQKTQSETALLLIDRLQANMLKRFGKIETNRILAVSTILDPRFKRLHFESSQLIACSQATNYISKYIKEIEQKSMNTDVENNLENTQPFTDESSNLWSHHEQLLKLQNTVCEERTQDDMSTDLKYYLNQPLAKLKENPMHYWSNQYRQMYPTLSIIARKFLPVVATSVPSERLFSRAGNILTDNRSRLSPTHLQKLLFLNSLPAKDWYLH